MWFRRRRKPKIDPVIASWLVAFREERIAAPPWQREFRVPGSIHIDRYGEVTYAPETARMSRIDES